jgi:hypothetical protein
MTIRRTLRYTAVAAAATLVVTLVLGGVFRRRLAIEWHRRGLAETIEVERRHLGKSPPVLLEDGFIVPETILFAEMDEPSAFYAAAHRLVGTPGDEYFYSNTWYRRHYHLKSLRALGDALSETEAAELAAREKK